MKHYYVCFLIDEKNNIIKEVNWSNHVESWRYKKELFGDGVQGDENCFNVHSNGLRWWFVSTEE